MFKKIAIALSAILLMSACNGPPVPKAANPSNRIGISGASILPPQEMGWQIAHHSETGLSLVKPGRQPDATYAAFVALQELPELETEEQFAQAMTQKFLAETDNERFALSRNEGEAFSRDGGYCWRYHKIAEDRAARTKTGRKVMLLESIGHICQHPQDRRNGLHIQYSHRYHSGNQDLEIERQAKDFFDGVTFTDLVSASVSPSVDKEAETHYHR